MDTPQALEVFSGSARLAKALAAVGFASQGLDYGGNKDTPQHKTIQVDVGTKEGQDLFWHIVATRNVKFVHVAPPCGTASRVREIRRSSGPNPPPLRSNDYPDGLPGLSPTEAQRVQKANELYEFVASACLKLSSLGISWTAENPANSLMWRTTASTKAYAELQSLAHFSTVQFHMCMHGGERDKLVQVGLAT